MSAAPLVATATVTVEYHRREGALRLHLRREWAGIRLVNDSELIAKLAYDLKLLVASGISIEAVKKRRTLWELASHKFAAKNDSELTTNIRRDLSKAMLLVGPRNDIAGPIRGEALGFLLRTDPRSFEDADSNRDAAIELMGLKGQIKAQAFAKVKYERELMQDLAEIAYSRWRMDEDPFEWSIEIIAEIEDSFLLRRRTEIVEASRVGQGAPIYAGQLIGSTFGFGVSSDESIVNEVRPIYNCKLRALFRDKYAMEFTDVDVGGMQRFAFEVIPAWSPEVYAVSETCPHGCNRLTVRVKPQGLLSNVQSFRDATHTQDIESIFGSRLPVSQSSDGSYAATFETIQEHRMYGLLWDGPRHTHGKLLQSWAENEGAPAPPDP